MKDLIQHYQLILGSLTVVYLAPLLISSYKRQQAHISIRGLLKGVQESVAGNCRWYFWHLIYCTIVALIVYAKGSQ